MEAIDGVPVLPFADAAAWEAWLDEHHGEQAGVWLKLAKKHSGMASVSDDEVVDVGLCYGWVSGQRRALDETHYLQKYVPRRARSLWSRVNVDKVERLLAAGRMRQPGMAEVHAAQADGRWAAAYESQRTATVPEDVVAAMKGRSQAKAAFDALDRTAQYRRFLPVLQARNPTIRAARVDALIAELEADAGGADP